jgi:hypothetical protein
MTAPMRCALPDCSRPATVVYRMRPRRDREPLCPEIKRATDWPGQSQPTSVAACSKCSGQVRDAAITILGVAHVEEPVAVVVTEGEGE